MISAYRGRHAAFGAYVAVSVLIFWRLLGAVVAYSLSHESSSHIVLIPLVSLYLLFAERERIFASPRASVAPATVLILAGAVIYWLAYIRGSQPAGTASFSAATLALVLVWAGGFFLCYGKRAARAAAFPLLFLLLMVPLPEGVVERAIVLLQKGSTEISCLFFRIAGVPVYRQGFLLAVPGVKIEVAKECSGIRSSIALFITCLLAAHLFLRTSWKQIVFVLLAFPLAIIKNGIRIATLTLLSVYVDPGFLTGRLHHEGGFVFFLLALAILAPVLRLLQKSETRPSSPISGGGVTAEQGLARGV
jgi:exosortase